MHVAKLFASHTWRAAPIAVQVYVLAPRRSLRLLQVLSRRLFPFMPVLFQPFSKKICDPLLTISTKKPTK
jgi:hypothetical protein